jgi:hypothetical protein
MLSIIRLKTVLAESEMLATRIATCILKLRVLYHNALGCVVPSWNFNRICCDLKVNWRLNKTATFFRQGWGFLRDSYAVKRSQLPARCKNTLTYWGFRDLTGFWIWWSNLLVLYTTFYNILQITIFDWTLSTSDNTSLIHYSNWYLSQSQSQSYFTTDGLPPISASWRQAPWDSRQVILFSNWTLAVIVLM